MIQKAGILITVLLLIGAGLFAMNGKRVVEYSSQQFLMDTLVTIKVYGKDREQLRSAVNEAFAEMRHIAELSDRFPKPGSPAFLASDVCKINQMAGKQPVHVQPDTLAMLAMAQHYAELTGGAFDSTIGPVMDLWSFGSDTPSVPNPSSVQKALALVDWRAVVLDQVAGTVYLKKPGMKLDLGAVAKGYATEKASRLLQQRGIVSGLLDAGGNIRTIGINTAHKPWKIGIKDPRMAGKLAAVVTVQDASAVTSGDYYRSFEQDGLRYHHLINPHTGYPARHTRSSTVLTKDAGVADILSTAFFILPPDQALQLAEKLDGVDLVLITADGALRYTRPLQNRIIQENATGQPDDQRR